MKYDGLTIVTSCNRDYLPGVKILVHSIRQHGMNCRIEVLPIGLNTYELAELQKLPDIHVQKPVQEESMHTQKMDAFLAARGEVLAWIDADCMVTGDITEGLLTVAGQLKIRLRDEAENREVFKPYYRVMEARGGIPGLIAARWSKDIAERIQPRFNAQCVTNVLSLHRSDLFLVTRWRSMMTALFPNGYRGVVQRNTPAYFMTDESVLSAILNYSHDVPEIQSYCQHALHDSLVHFSLQPKPWVKMTKRHSEFADDVQAYLSAY